MARFYGWPPGARLFRTAVALRSWYDHGRTVNGIVFYGSKSIIGLIEREHRDLGTKIDFTGKLEKISCVSAGHVGNASHLALAPQQAIVIKLRNTIQMDRVDGNYTAPAQAGQGSENNVSAGREGHRAVELNGRLFNV